MCIAIALGAGLGCSSAETANLSSSDEDFTSTSSGLWALDGPADDGDIELLQLTRYNYASIVRRVVPAAAAEAVAEEAGLERGSRASAPAPMETEERRAAMGNVTRAFGAEAAAPTLSLSAAEQEHTVAELGDTLMLTREDGRVLTYRRSYRLYCVPTDRSLEATVVLELGKEPEIVGVNGDGRTFPAAGAHEAAVRTDVLFRLHDYVVVSHTGSSLITVKLPWTEMSKHEIEGTLAIVGPPDASAPTPITCERVMPIDY